MKNIEAMEYIAGSCMTSPIMALEAILGTYPSAVQIKEFEQFLDQNECYECEHCGWWTHPGEFCDCEDENET